MKENIIKKKIKEGKLVLGSYCSPDRPYLIEVMAEAGYDFVVLDTEHGPYYGVEHCVDGVKTAELAGITPFIRVSHNNPIIIQKALEIGAYGVWVPHVDSEKECRQAVQAAKFPPEGTRSPRGISTEQLKFVNDQIMVTVLPLESKQAIDNIDGTLSVRGLDMVSLSTGDITYALGYPGQPMHPEVVKVRDSVYELCKKKGVTAYAVGNHDILRYYFMKGVRVFMSGVNIQRAFHDHVTELHKILC